jgi:hypothetical protein
MSNSPRQRPRPRSSITYLTPASAQATVGGMCMEFVLEADTWPLFYEWLCTQVPEFRLAGPRAVRNDVARVLATLPPKAGISATAD